MKKTTIVLLIVLLGGALFVWSGAYNIAATDKHWAVTNELLEILRERSIEVRAKDIVVPENLEDSTLIASGAGNYEEMCSSCHLAPGVENTEIYEGLYPQPPVFNGSAHDAHDEKDNFWVIKNGIKLTGMPAWGASHTDDDIWALVAFINQLDEMSADEYLEITAGGEGHDDSPADEEEHEDASADEDLHQEIPADEEEHQETTSGGET
ncbi:MAG: hypothetical protein BMS9Abin30_0402 [Gammaproteobacteria bacterium]|nr:MAG: hypothetical protein BMS9Abin30_0402 [Gammaproteobacteria bacterium]